MEQVHLKYGTSAVDFEIDGAKSVKYLYENKMRVIEDIKAEFLHCVTDGVIGTKPLKELIAPTDPVTIVISDMTRFWMRQDVICELLVKYLHDEMGVGYDQIAVVVALVTHRKNTAEDRRKLASEFVYDHVASVTDHDCDAPDLVYIGTTSFGTRVSVNPLAVGRKAICIGGTSAEMCLSTVKKASAGYLDELPTSGNEGGRCFRDLEWEEKVLKICRESGVGAQFGGKYLVHDVRVIRAPRHAASCPVAIGVSCSADRNIRAKITPEGIFLEKLEKNPARFLPAEAPAMSPAVDIDLDEGMDKVRAILTKYPIKTRLNLRGTLIVARDIAHARIKQMLDEGKPMPEYFRKHPVYYAGPAKTPQGMASGSFGPTTAGRMDPYVDLFQKHGGSMVMVAKGNRSQAVTDACKANGGFYLGSIGGPAAILAKNSIKSVEVVDFPELGMEAVRKIYVEDFPAFIIVDDKGNDFFADFKH